MANPKLLGCFLFLSLSFSPSFSLPGFRIEAGFNFTTQPEPQALNHHSDPDSNESNGSDHILTNSRLEKAHNALQSWKKSIHSDPSNFTGNWAGPDVCSYNGVFCSRSLNGSDASTVAGVDLNGADIAGHLPDEIGHLDDVSLLHLNSNRFSGVVPESIGKLKLLFELDLSNNRFGGPFPRAVLGLPELKYLDLRFNDFEGEIPEELFEKDLDAIFLNNNRFGSKIPESLGKSRASVVVLAGNKLEGCIPRSIGDMAGSLDELIMSSNGLSGCLPQEITLLNTTTVFDVSKNRLVGDLPKGLEHMNGLEIMNVGKNKFRGDVPGGLCALPNLTELTFSYNYFESKDRSCDSSNVTPGLKVEGDRNCFVGESYQRAEKKCRAVLRKQVDCKATGCRSPPSSEYSSPPLPPKQSPPHTVPAHYPSPSPGPVYSPPPPPPTSIVYSPINLPDSLGASYKSPPPPVIPGY